MSGTFINSSNGIWFDASLRFSSFIVLPIIYHYMKSQSYVVETWFIFIDIQPELWKKDSLTYIVVTKNIVTCITENL